MSGGSRGIGLSIALRAAREGANIAFIAKSDVEDPRLPGTVHTAAAEIEAAGGSALPIVGDVRNAEAVEDAVRQCVDTFGGVDIVVNNASAIDLRGWQELERKRFDLLLDVNVRGTFNLTSAALPYLLKSDGAHVLTLSPPINMNRSWFEAHAPYTLTKYSMTMLTLGLAAQYEGTISANCLWPQTLIATAAVNNVVAGEEGMRAARTPEIMSDASAVILSRQDANNTGQCYIDAQVLASIGRSDLSRYAAVPGTPDADLQLDLFVEDVQ